MNKTLVLSAFVALTAIAATATLVEARTWTQASTGKTLEGDFVRVRNDNVMIKMADGNIRELPLAMLTDEDRSFVESQATAGEPMKAPEGETTVLLSGVHLCCGGCEKGINAAVDGLEDVEIDVSRSDETVTIKGKSGDAAQKAVTAIAEAGYYGKSDSDAIKIADAGADSSEAGSVSVSGVHLCCGSCVKAVDRAIKTLGDGVEHTAKSKESDFEVTGKVSPAAVLAALQAQGINGTVK